MFLFGKAGSGKTTTATYLRSNYDYRMFALASPIKSKLVEMLERQVTKADRALMIEFGQSYRRWFGQDVWCRLAWDGILGQWTSDLLHSRKTPSQSPVVVEDGRHLVEYDFFVKDRGFIAVRIAAPDEMRFQRLLDRDGVDQRGVLAGQETELDDVAADYTIVNDGNDLVELYRKIDEVMRQMRGEA